MRIVVAIAVTAFVFGFVAASVEEGGESLARAAGVGVACAAIAGGLAAVWTWALA